MAKIPSKPVLDAIKKAAPPTAKFVTNHWEKIAATIPVAVKGVKEVNNFIDKKKNSSKKEQNIPYRKAIYKKFIEDILPELNNMKRKELMSAKLEVEKFIQQIHIEEDKEFRAKKMLHTKRISNWNHILIQITDKMKSRDYQEYILIYNNPNYLSEYFDGYDSIISKYKNILASSNNDEICEFIFENTDKTRQTINKDFLL